MDGELYLALVVLWTTTTYALVTFFYMWFSNTGAGFHPHSVDVTDRHPTFLVVGSGTTCKMDSAVKSISAFVAPRGSSSSSNFQCLTMVTSIVGVLGSRRWFAVGDASETEALLSMVGFGALMLVAGYELDISSHKFLNDKLMVTCWFADKLLDKRKALGLRDLHLPFEIDPDNADLRACLFHSSLAHLYPESSLPPRSDTVLRRSQRWAFMHMIGSVAYVFFVSGAVVLNEWEELRAGIITWTFFVLFCLCSYLTGEYIPVFKCFRFYLLIWNPFYYEQEFLPKLHAVLYEAATEADAPTRGRVDVTGTNIRSRSKSKCKARGKSRGRGRSSTRSMTSTDTAEKVTASTSTSVGDESFDWDENEVLDTMLLQMCKYSPQLYLHLVGYLLVMVNQALSHPKRSNLTLILI